MLRMIKPVYICILGAILFLMLPVFVSADVKVDRIHFAADGSLLDSANKVVKSQGDWNALTTYSVNDVVTYQGTLYICTASSQGTLPTNTSFWTTFAAQGLQGVPGNTGPQGPQGIQGPIGATGPAGPTGPQGLQGIQGAAGANGSNGVNGKGVLSGTTVPANTVGSDGDFYLNSVSAVLYGPKVNGVWPVSGTSLIGPQGPQGATGAQGPAGISGTTGSSGIQGQQGIQGVQGVAGVTTVMVAGNAALSGVIDPTPDIGVDGDFYVNIQTNMLFGPKANGSWPQGSVSIIGPQGLQGIQGIQGPQGIAGIDGQRGPQGEIGLQGPQGAQGPQGIGINGVNGIDGKTVRNGVCTGKPADSLGVDGDFYICTNTSLLYGPKANSAWPVTGLSLIGPQGPAGPQGPIGPTGATGPEGIQGPTGPAGQVFIAGKAVLSGAVNPGGGTGVDGDFYVNTATYMIFGPKSNGFWPDSGVSIIGPQGPQGLQGTTGATGPQGPAPTGACAADQKMLGVNANGTVTCGTDANTTYTAGVGLSLVGTSFGASFASSGGRNGTATTVARSDHSHATVIPVPMSDFTTMFGTPTYLTNVQYGNNALSFSGWTLHTGDCVSAGVVIPPGATALPTLIVNVRAATTGSAIVRADAVGVVAGAALPANSVAGVFTSTITATSGIMYRASGTPNSLGNFGGNPFVTAGPGDTVLFRVCNGGITGSNVDFTLTGAHWVFN